MKIALIFEYFGPYHLVRLQAAAAQGEVVGAELSGSSGEYGWEPMACFPSLQLETIVRDCSHHDLPLAKFQQRFAKVMECLNPDVVAVPGWGRRSSLVAIAWCQQRNVPWVLMSESTAWDDARQPVKEWMKSMVIRFSSAALVGGASHRDYLAMLGMPSDRIHLGYDVVDHDYFARNADAARGTAEEVRLKNGLPDRYFLASARFIPKKNLSLLVDAYARYRVLSVAAGGQATLQQPWDLVLLGDGPLRPALEKQIDNLSLRACVHLPGFKQYPELPAYYGLAQAFIHASTVEQWGLVVNEAMSSALPVLVSNRCGCARDLVQEGLNGFAFDPANSDQLARLMLKISSMPTSLTGNPTGVGTPPTLAALGAASRQIAAAWGPARFGAGLVAAAARAYQVGPCRGSLAQRLMLALLLRRPEAKGEMQSWRWQSASGKA